jgi:UDP-3-O-[3-hydroxymyristoyl] glucosamine N-acyltransferase
MKNLCQLANHVNGVLMGDSECIIHHVASLKMAILTDIAFLNHSKWSESFAQTQAGCVIMPHALYQQFKKKRWMHEARSPLLNVILCDDSTLAFAQIAEILNDYPKPATQISSKAHIASSARLGKGVAIASGASIGKNSMIGNNVIIGANVVVGENVCIDDNTLIYPSVTIYPYTQIGQDCILHANCVIGSDGFGFTLHEEEWIKIPQMGKVIIGHRVEIGANTCIDRGALDNTYIHDGVKIDNLCHIAHNVHVGKNTAMAAFTGIAGSTTIGQSCTLSGRSSIIGHLNIAPKTHLTAGTLVSKSNTHSAVFSSGTGAQENTLWRKNAARFKQLDTLAKRLYRLEKEWNAKKHHL